MMIPALDIEKKINKILENRRNFNLVKEIFNAIEGNESYCIPCMKGLERLFTSLLQRKEFNMDERLKVIDSKELEVEMKYNSWLQKIYDKTIILFYELLDSNKKDIANQALISLMSFLSFEGKYPIARHQKDNISSASFPVEKLKQIIQIFISVKSRKTHLLICFEKYLKYKDIFFYTWKILSKLVTYKQGRNDITMLNLLELLERIPLSKMDEEKVGDHTENESQVLCKPEGIKEFVMNTSQVQKFMNKVWQNMISQSISLTIHRKLMVILLEKFLPTLDNPIYFTDFFIASVNLGGANGLLAMQGILTLVRKCNIEYPNIYGKLYTMFEPTIFQTKYKSRLFYLADIFLSSTHLPENLVAAFAKRIARLSINAQVADVFICIRFIENLLIRHPGLKKMINHPEGGEVEKDPFLSEECNPIKTRAVESCLWEISLFKNHIQPTVSSSANFIDSGLPNIEFSLEEFCDVTDEQLFKIQLKRKLRPVLSTSRPQKIAKLTDDRVYRLWMLA